jgi:hypothetical protein
VLRLRLVGDNIFATTLQQLWTIGWDRRTLDDLEGALDEWGFPNQSTAMAFGTVSRSCSTDGCREISPSSPHSVSGVKSTSRIWECAR